MTKARSRLGNAFTLLEIVIALAMLALIAIPAIGLATMAIKQSSQSLVEVNSTELKRRIDAAVKADNQVFTWSLPIVMIASSDLQYIEHQASVTVGSNDAFFRIEIDEPAGYNFNNLTDAYRVFTYNITWPNSGATGIEASQQIYLTVVRK